MIPIVNLLGRTIMRRQKELYSSFNMCMPESKNFRDEGHEDPSSENVLPRRYQ